jgi:hypothetical protein
VNGAPRYPRQLADWVRLDPELLSPYVTDKGERLALAEHKVRFLREHWWSGRVSFPFEVGGDTGGPYVVWVEPYRPDGVWAHCSRGGDHDRQKPGTPCGHMTAATVELYVSIVPGLSQQLPQPQQEGAP